jgi:Family of unknown function (DUF6544)
LNLRAKRTSGRETTAPRGLTERARADWAMLAQPTDTPDRFHPAATVGLPEPVRRWLAHAIAPGTPLRSAVELRMHGQIRPGAWRPFTAVQRLTPGDGFVWAATARLFGLPVTGFDRFTQQLAGGGDHGPVGRRADAPAARLARALGPPHHADRGDRAQVLDQHPVDGESALA